MRNIAVLMLGMFLFCSGEVRPVLGTEVAPHDKSLPELQPPISWSLALAFNDVSSVHVSLLSESQLESVHGAWWEFVWFIARTVLTSTILTLSDVHPLYSPKPLYGNRTSRGR